jgi:hypothetical protein
MHRTAAGAAPIRASEKGAKAPVDGLSAPMRDLLWTVAQHQYGWAHVLRFGGQLQVADALVRRGLVVWGLNGRDHTEPRVVATEKGRMEIRRRWPVSPFVLGTYEHQPGGWSPRDSSPGAQHPEREALYPSSVPSSRGGKT